MQPTLNPVVMAWLNTQRATELWLTAVSLHEIVYGIERLPAGRQRTSLDASLQVVLSSGLGNRILALDADAARRSAMARITAERAVGSYDIPDCLIAGIAAARGATVATRNIRDFRHFGVALVDPWQA